jgi:hypothetical protein
MRRIVVFLMASTGIATIIAGIAESSPRHGSLPQAHIVFAVLFFIMCVIHIYMNRKAVGRYLRGK